VFHHFDDMEQVLRAAVAVQVERHWRRLRVIDPALGRAERIDHLVRQRAWLYERISPVRRAAAVVEHTSPTVAAELAHARRRLRAQLEDAFGSELASRGPSGSAGLLDALELSTSWEAWEQLRQCMGRSAAEAGRVMTSVVDAVLASPAEPGGGT
ncbi:MAG: hypothetical protein ACYDB3_06250, partial [Acidimicrobiales bacterium]